MPRTVFLHTLSEEEYASLLHVAQGEKTRQEHCQEFRRGDRTLRALLRDLEVTTAPPPEPEILLRDMDDLDEDVERLWSHAESYQYQTRKQRNTEWDYHLDLKTDLPVLIAWVADMHIGHLNSDLRKIRADLLTVRNTEGMYVIFGGDDGENTTSSRAHHGAHHERLLDTKAERRFVEHALTLPGHDKVLGVGEGNHTDRSVQDDGESWLRRMCEVNGLHYYGYRQRFNIKVGRHQYQIICAHRHRGGGMDKTRPAKKLMDEWGDADAVLVGHRHDPATSQEEVRQSTRIFAQAGSYKSSDHYSESHGFAPSKAAMPGLILWPDTRRVDVLYDVFSSVGMFSREREHYARQMESREP